MPYKKIAYQQKERQQEKAEQPAVPLFRVFRLYFSGQKKKTELN